MLNHGEFFTHYQDIQRVKPVHPMQKTALYEADKSIAHEGTCTFESVSRYMQRFVKE